MINFDEEKRRQQAMMAMTTEIIPGLQRQNKVRPSRTDGKDLLRTVGIAALIFLVLTVISQILNT